MLHSVQIEVKGSGKQLCCGGAHPAYPNAGIVQAGPTARPAGWGIGLTGTGFRLAGAATSGPVRPGIKLRLGLGPFCISDSGHPVFAPFSRTRFDIVSRQQARVSRMGGWITELRYAYRYLPRDRGA